MDIISNLQRIILSLIFQCSFLLPFYSFNPLFFHFLRFFPFLTISQFQVFFSELFVGFCFDLLKSFHGFVLIWPRPSEIGPFIQRRTFHSLLIQRKYQSCILLNIKGNDRGSQSLILIMHILRGQSSSLTPLLLPVLLLFHFLAHIDIHQVSITIHSKYLPLYLFLIQNL